MVRSSPRIHFESGASVFAVLCFLPMNGAGPGAPEPGDSRGVTTGGTTGSRALGSDIERHGVHGATHSPNKISQTQISQTQISPPTPMPPARDRHCRPPTSPPPPPPPLGKFVFPVIFRIRLAHYCSTVVRRRNSSLGKPAQPLTYGGFTAAKTHPGRKKL